MSASRDTGARAPLTVHLAGLVGEVLGFASRCAFIVWEDPDAGCLLRGTARSVGDEHGNLVFGADVRDLFLRITTDHGHEHFMAFAQACELLDAGLMAQESQ